MHQASLLTANSLVLFVIAMKFADCCMKRLFPGWIVLPKYSEFSRSRPTCDFHIPLYFSSWIADTGMHKLKADSHRNAVQASKRGTRHCGKRHWLIRRPYLKYEGTRNAEAGPCVDRDCCRSNDDEWRPIAESANGWPLWE